MAYPHRYFAASYFPGRYFPPLEDAEDGAGMIRGGRSVRSRSLDEILKVRDPYASRRADDEVSALALLLAFL